MLRLHNTLTKTVDEFKPISNDKVTIYTCGPTVYNFLHVGNWVSYIRWDTLIRALIEVGYDPVRVMNITDVGHLVSDADEGEDKMQKGARREGVTAWEIAQRYTDDFMEGMNRLNLIRPQHITKATEYIPQQIALITKLEEKGYTYSTSDGIYFDTARFPSYRDFANLDIDGMKAGARVEYSDEKRSPSDFALWKFSPQNEQRDMEWDSPWGRGFPGWHIECSAMAMEKLGETIDIHTGGIDHIPVHHTNEIAQSEAATDKRFANYWLHSNFLMVNGTKISKSLNNGYTLQDLSDKGYSPLEFRMFVLQSHYRTESNFTWDNLEAVKNRLKNWSNTAALRHQTIDPPYDDQDYSTSEASVLYLNTGQAVKNALQDDLNTPHAFSLIEEAFSYARTHMVESADLKEFESLLELIDRLLGLELLSSSGDIDDETKDLIDQRQQAREARNWEQADTIRDLLAKKDITVRDTKHGAVWERI